MIIIINKQSWNIPSCVFFFLLSFFFLVSSSLSPGLAADGRKSVPPPGRERIVEQFEFFIPSGARNRIHADIIHTHTYIYKTRIYFLKKKGDEERGNGHTSLAAPYIIRTWFFVFSFFLKKLKKSEKKRGTIARLGTSVRFYTARAKERAPAPRNSTLIPGKNVRRDLGAPSFLCSR